MDRNTLLAVLDHYRKATMLRLRKDYVGCDYFDAIMRESEGQLLREWSEGFFDVLTPQSFQAGQKVIDLTREQGGRLLRVVE